MRIPKLKKKITHHSTFRNNKEKISLKLKLAEKSWLFSIAASFIGLLSLLTPILYIRERIYARSTLWIDIQEWIFGYYNGIIDLSPGSGFPGFFEEFIPLPMHVIATALIVICHFAILVIATIKLKKKEQFISPNLIYFSIVTMLVVIGYAIYFWIYLEYHCIGTGCYGSWESYVSPGFAVYGQFISGFFVNINYYLGKTKR